MLSVLSSVRIPCIFEVALTVISMLPVSNNRLGGGDATILLFCMMVMTSVLARAW